jgi:hypothetical protein
MRAALAHDDAFNRDFTAGTRQTRTPKNFQLILIAASVPGNRIKISFAGSKGCAKIFQAAF